MWYTAIVADIFLDRSSSISLRTSCEHFANRFNRIFRKESRQKDSLDS